MKRLLISCGLLLLSVLAVSAQSGSATWMANLPDKAFISQLSLPGTHDAATGEGVSYSSYAKVQSKTLDEQWACGVRVFDLRVQDDDGTLNLYHGIGKCDINFAEAMTKITGYVTTNPTEFAIVLLRDESNGGGASPWNTDVATELANHSNLVSTFRADLTVGEMRGKVLVLTRDNGGTAIAGTTKMDNWGDNTIKLDATVGGSRLRLQDIYNETASGATTEKDNGIKNLLSASLHRAAGDYTWFINHASGYTEVGLFSKAATVSNIASNAARTNQLFIDELEGETGGAGIVMMDFAGDDKAHSKATNGQKLVDALVAQNFKTRPYEIQLVNGDLNINSSQSGNAVEISSYDGWTLTYNTQTWKVNNSSQYCFSGRWAESYVAPGTTLGDRQLSQKITLPPGTYNFSCSALTTGTGASYFIGSASGDIADNSKVGTAQKPISLTLSETQEVELGVKLSGYTGNWFAVDNFHLTTDAFEEKGSTANLNITPWLVANPTFDNNNSAGWNCTSNKGTGSATWGSTTFKYNIVENYQYDLSLLQSVTLPVGYYELCVRGFERTAANADAYAARESATVNSWLLAGDDSQTLQNIFTDAPTSSSGFSGSFYTDQSGIATPNNMQAAASVLNAGYYENALPFAVETAGDVNVGVKVSNQNWGQWTAFDDFRLFRLYTVTIDDDHTFTPLATTIDVVLDRQFSDDTWSTLVLPFDVEDPTAVLGNVTVAKFVSATDTHLSFSTQEGQNIEANVPVLIKGTFNTAPYRFENVTIEVPTNGLSTETLSGYALVGSYEPLKAVPQGSYILYNGKFYRVNTSNVVVDPSRAYVSVSESSAAKTKSLVVDDEDVTAIQSVSADAADRAATYDLSGRRVNEQNLRGGIYLRGGQKLLVK